MKMIVGFSLAFSLNAFAQPAPGPVAVSCPGKHALTLTAKATDGTRRVVGFTQQETLVALKAFFGQDSTQLLCYSQRPVSYTVSVAYPTEALAAKYCTKTSYFNHIAFSDGWEIRSPEPQNLPVQLAHRFENVCLYMSKDATHLYDLATKTVEAKCIVSGDRFQCY